MWEFDKRGGNLAFPMIVLAVTRNPGVKGYLGRSDQTNAIIRSDLLGHMAFHQPVYSHERRQVKGSDATIETKVVGREFLMRAAFEKAIESLPEGRHQELLALVQEFVEKAKHQPSRPLPAPGSGTYRTVVPRLHMSKEELKEFLGREWGEFLKAFNSKLDRDYMSQADLSERDESLLNRLRQQYGSKELSRFLPSHPEMIKQEAAQMTAEEIQDVQKKIGWIYRYISAA